MKASTAHLIWGLAFLSLASWALIRGGDATPAMIMSVVVLSAARILKEMGR